MLALPVVAASGRRSSVPDLLFEDEQIVRVAEIEPYLEHPQDVSSGVPLHRVTVFLTYRCNLACVYCKTIARTPEELEQRPQKAVSYTPDMFAALLLKLADMPIRHLHFTGGEATLIQELPEMIRLARRSGVEKLSITSNGVMPVETYLRLIDAGLDEVRISIDADSPDLARALSLRDSAWQRTVETIRRLAKAKREGRTFYLILNAVIGGQNRSRLPEILHFLLSLGPDDIKLITEVDARDTLASSPDGRSLLAEAARLLKPYDPDAFPLLRRKLHTVFAPDAIGLDRVGDAADWRCYIPLTERTVDGEYYYPCSVYLREGGDPLGRLSDSAEEQRAKTAEFVRHGDCLRDPICHRYCLHCTRAYNVRANEARRP